VEGVFVVEAGAEVNPGEAMEEARKLLLAGLPPAAQQDRDYPKAAIVAARFQRRTHLLVLPRADRLAEEDGAGATLVEGLLQRLLPGLAGDEMPLSRNGSSPSSRSLWARCSTAGLSALAWLRKTS